MLEEKTLKKYNAWKLPKLLEEAQFWVNKRVRERDQLNDFGDFRCISCLKVNSKDQCNAGHYFARGNYGSVRFDFDNIHSQCIKCNLHLHGNLIPYRENLIRKIGVERFLKLETLANLRGFKHDRFILVDIIERLKGT